MNAKIVKAERNAKQKTKFLFSLLRRILSSRSKESREEHKTNL